MYSDRNQVRGCLGQSSGEKRVVKGHEKTIEVMENVCFLDRGNDFTGV